MKYTLGEKWDWISSMGQGYTWEITGVGTNINEYEISEGTRRWWWSESTLDSALQVRNIIQHYFASTPAQSQQQFISSAPWPTAWTPKYKVGDWWDLIDNFGDRCELKIEAVPLDSKDMYKYTLKCDPVGAVNSISWITENGLDIHLSTCTILNSNKHNPIVVHQSGGGVAPRRGVTAAKALSTTQSMHNKLVAGVYGGAAEWRGGLELEDCSPCKCTCGSASVGSPIHSDWCDL